MEEIFNINTFIQYLTYYIKIGVYINKGTDKEVLLERCIKVYNKYKMIEASGKVSPEDDATIRRCMKRLNLVLKVNDDGTPIDIKNKENQLKMLQFHVHSSLVNNDLNSMIEHATKYNITILTDIPLMFILRESKYQKLLWEYTRALFFISQILICNSNFGKNVMKEKIIDESAEKLEHIIETMSKIEDEIKLNQIMTMDKFLGSKLIKTGVNEKNVNEAKEEVKEIFMKKGLGENNSMARMIDSISDKLSSVDLSKGNIIQNMFGIAQHVAQEMKGDLENNPENFQDTLGAITEVFKEAINDGDNVPSELKGIFDMISGVGNDKSFDPEMGDEEIMKNLDSLISANGLNKEDFYNTIKGEDGQINVSKLENLLTNLK